MSTTHLFGYAAGEWRKPWARYLASIAYLVDLAWFAWASYVILFSSVPLGNVWISWLVLATAVVCIAGLAIVIGGVPILAWYAFRGVKGALFGMVGLALTGLCGATLLSVWIRWQDLAQPMPVWAWAIVAIAFCFHIVQSLLKGILGWRWPVIILIGKNAIRYRLSVRELPIRALRKNDCDDIENQGSHIRFFMKDGPFLDIPAPESEKEAKDLVKALNDWLGRPAIRGL